MRKSSKCHGAFSSLEPEKTVSIPRDFALDSDISTIIASTNTWVF